MKKILFVLIITLFVARANSQIFISANPNDTVKEKSAMFEVRSSTKGFLPPRMSTAERKAIVDPTPGLMVFDTSKQMFYGFTKALGWRPFSMGLDTSMLSEPY